MRRLLTLAVLLLLAPAGGDASAPAGVHDFDAAGLVQTLLTHSVVVTFHTRWRASPCFHCVPRDKQLMRRCTQVRAVRRRRAGV